MKLVIYRHTPNIKEDRNIIGDLHIDGKFFCHTLEDEIREKGVKVYGKTAIDTGKYNLVLSVSNRFKRLMPLLENVPNFSGVRLHGGNTSQDSHGCPLIAFNTDGVKIWGSAERSLTKLLKESDEKHTIEIKNSFLSYNKELKIDELG
jgi:hypothetical protein